ncbi:MAG: VCBS repeat-containing protein, partial [Ignavibacteria bacterium]
MKKTFIFLFIILVYTYDACPQTPFFYIEALKVDSLRAPFRKPGIPLITDLEKDGQKEIIFYVLDYNGGASPLGELYVINSFGTNYPGFPKGMDDYPLDISSGDVNGDGFLDIALRYTNSIDIIDRFGNSLMGFPITYSDGTIDPPKSLSLYDLDNDGKLEIIVSKVGEVCVFNYDGSIRPGWPRHIAGKAGYNPAIGDIDNDGLSEIITTSFRIVNNLVDSGAVTVFRENGNIFPGTWPLQLDSNYYSWSSSPSLYIDKN